LCESVAHEILLYSKSNVRVWSQYCPSLSLTAHVEKCSHPLKSA
jgi:hypothetical protein